MTSDSTSPKLLVTGAAGFIAFHTIRKLLQEDIAVVGVDNFDPFYPRAIKEQNLADLRQVAREVGASFTFHEADICEMPDDFLSDETIAGVVHLAARAGVRPSIEDPEGYTRTNVHGTVRLLEWCRHRGIDTFLFGSSSSVYGNDTPAPFSEEARADRPISPYAASKRAGELYCASYAHLYGIKVLVLRLFTVYGPRQRPDLAIHKFARRLDAGEALPLFGNGSSQRDYTYVDDIVDGLLAAWQRAQQMQAGTFEVFNLGGSATTSLNELVTTLEQSLGKEGKRDWQGTQAGDVDRTWADLARSRATLQFSPRVGFAEGIRRFVAWFRSTPHT